MRSACAPLLVALPAACGHGAMVEPASRQSRGVRQNVPGGDKSAKGRWSVGCPGWGCYFWTGGTDINCPEPNPTRKQAAASIYGVGPSPCEGSTNGVQPTMNTADVRSYDVDSSHAAQGWYTYHPWRYPGKAPVFRDDGCGTGGGANMGIAACKERTSTNGAGGAGTSGSDLSPLSHKTLWTAGEAVDVAFGVYANHGGGYQYRICPRNKTGNLVSEECFQKTPLKFVGETSWLQKWDDPSVRQPFKATTVTNGTWPEGSTWRRNPVPACVAKSNGLKPFNPPEGQSGGSADTGCAAPLFPAVETDLFNKTYGWGISACVVGCTDADYDRNALDFYVVDKVQVPADLPPGDYVVGWRWDCEQTPQIWHSCADVTVQPAGNPVSETFRPIDGCDVCNLPTGPCSHCKPCVNDTTGDCSDCWKKPSCKTTPSARMLPACLGQDSPFFDCVECWSQGKGI